MASDGPAPVAKFSPPHARARESARLLIGALEEQIALGIASVNAEHWDSWEELLGEDVMDGIAALRAAINAPAEPFPIVTGDPGFDPDQAVTINGFRYLPAAMTLPATAMLARCAETFREYEHHHRHKKPNRVTLDKAERNRIMAEQIETLLYGAPRNAEPEPDFEAQIDLTAGPSAADAFAYGIEAVRCFLGAPLLGKVGEGDRPRPATWQEHERSRAGQRIEIKDAVVERVAEWRGDDWNTTTWKEGAAFIVSLDREARTRLKDGEYRARDVAAYLASGEFHAMIEHPASKRRWAEMIWTMAQLIDEAMPVVDFVNMLAAAEVHGDLIGGRTINHVRYTARKALRDMVFNPRTYTEAQRDAAYQVLCAIKHDDGIRLGQLCSARYLQAELDAILKALGMERAS